MVKIKEYIYNSNVTEALTDSQFWLNVKEKIQFKLE